ncbi:MAG: metallophosphoesterase family protein [Lachnospiraceae bacterium]|nr:metallophosphoesterase family protein [Lachnospiraceae bacterium]
MDRFFLMPYIHTVSRVEKQQDRIIYQEALGVYTITTEKESFKLLQLTDIHLGGSLLSRSQDLKALKACYTLICHTRPDLVVITGDLVFPTGVKSFSLNNGAPLVQFAAFMRNTGIPWVFAYGNHDTERVATLDAREFDSLMKTLSCANPGSLLYPDIQPDISGRNNQMIEIRNTDGALRQALFLLDSNAYRNRADGGKGYDYIHDDQVAWYQKTVTALSEKEGYTIPSMAFFHIPLREYKEADERYRQGSDQVQYYYGVLGEKMSGRICCSREKSRFFDTAVELGSTKAMFCGHDHYNNQSLEYKGIRLTYGYSIDYLAMPGIERDTAQRGATLITIAPGGEFQIVPCRLSDLARK